MRKFLISCFAGMALLASAASADNLQGQNGAYWPPIPDVVPQASSQIVSATTTIFITGSSTLNTYVWWVAAYSTGTNSGASILLESGTGAGCAGSTHMWAPEPIGLNGSAGGGPAVLFGGAFNTAIGTGNGVVISNTPIVIPAAATPVNVCVLTAGSTVATTIYFVSIQRIN